MTIKPNQKDHRIHVDNRVLRGSSGGRVGWHGSCLGNPTARSFATEKTGDQSMLVPSPKWLDSGNNAWQLAAATFVGLQSIPGLAVLYAGYVKQKWAINSAFMCFYAFASVLVVWVLFDYNMAFGEQWFPFLGKPALATSATFLTGQATIPAAASGMPELTFPMATLIFFQFVFAAITVIILGGSVLGRMNFAAWVNIRVAIGKVNSGMPEAAAGITAW